MNLVIVWPTSANRAVKRTADSVRSFSTPVMTLAEIP